MNLEDWLKIHSFFTAHPDIRRKFPTSVHRLRITGTFFRLINRDCVNLTLATKTNKPVMEILLFGISKEIIGRQTLEVPKEANIKSVKGLKQWILSSYPEMGTIASFAIAVNQEYATDERLLGENQEIALLPPVSGG
ncbi:MoaD/ThiS family protein [Cyclobacterium xiamenense]|uniref:MoaD/ThiS family protein n=1 Tax=Cyclobacterium xiamenense TaxID=1297121 RepID=UPI0035CFCE5F